MGFSSSGAELESSPDSSTHFFDKQHSGSPAGWKQEANHRLAAHRARRSRRDGLQTTLPGMEDAVEPATAGHMRIRSVADRVAERYAKAPTYSEILASEARNAARAAQAAAVAACDARDAAEAILVGLDAGLESGLDVRRDGDHHKDSNRYEPGNHEAHRGKALDPRIGTISEARGNREFEARDFSASSIPLPAILEVVEEAEEFEEEPPTPIQPLPAKLLEFPRELIAARKARPRLAEGPLREEYDRGASQSQLRIFEVESETISTKAAVEPVLAGWSSIRLDSPAKAHLDVQQGLGLSTPQSLSANRQETLLGIDVPLQTASLEDRLMAGIVDAAFVVGGFLVFVLVFVACTAHPPAGKPAAIGAGIALFAFSLIYQILFFSFGQDTPGMRYAKVALCTFSDDNPTRKAMQRRIVALLLAASPLGIGLLWAFFDDDRLGWHDRISRTYQRSYR